MDINAVRTALAEAAEVIPGLSCYGFPADSISPPTFYAGDFELDFDQSGAGGMDEALITCYVLTSRADDRSGHEALGRFIARTGESSVKAALEADRTLGGVAEDLRVTECRSLGAEEVAGIGYIGAALTVRVMTQPEDD